MKRRSFLQIAGAAALVGGTAPRSGVAAVPTHNWDGHDFGAGPPVKDPKIDPRTLALPSAMGGLQTGCATDGKSVFTNGIDKIFTGTNTRNIFDPPSGGRVTSISLDTKTENWRHERPKVAWVGGTEEKPLFTNCGDPVASARTLAAITKQVDSMRARIEGSGRGNATPTISKTVANRAADDVDQVRGIVGGWYRYYDGYDPLFSWWVKEPYTTLDAAMTNYARAIRTRLVGLPATGMPDDVTVAKLGGWPA